MLIPRKKNTSRCHVLGMPMFLRALNTACCRVGGTSDSFNKLSNLSVTPSRTNRMQWLSVNIYFPNTVNSLKY